MSVPQITIRLSTEIKSQFAAYASQFGIRESELLRLLITRERIHQRLEKMAPQPLEERKERGRVRLPTVTAHMSSITDVQDFDDYASKCGINRNGAGLWLITTELLEQWLKKAIETA